MKRFALFLLIFLSSVSRAEFILEPGVSLTVGENQYSRTVTGTTTDHKEAWVAVGFGGEFKAWFRFESFLLGASSFVVWEGAKYRATAQGASVLTSTEYAVTNFRYGLGPAIGYQLPFRIRLMAEYFPLLENEFTYSQGAAVNAIRKGDKIRGSGWGAGLAINLVSGFNIFAIYRWLDFTKGKLAGNSVELPNSEFSRFKSGTFLSGASYSF